MTITTNTVIIGASAAGLASAACLKRADIAFELLEKREHTGNLWRTAYDRLHLHTNRAISSLPYTPMPASYPRYPAREQVVQYLEMYQQEHDLHPRFGQAVTSVEQNTDGTWQTVTATGETYISQHVIIATGMTNSANMPTWQGMESFNGQIIHSTDYKNPEPYQGKRVCVVGFGNSAGEIALDLAEHGIDVTLSVRGAVNIIPRDLFGVPILAVAIPMSLLPAKVADMLSAPMLRLTIGNYANTGLKPLPYGPNEQVKRDQSVPLLDIGTVKAIRQNKIAVKGGIDHFTADSVVFKDGEQVEFDAVICGTGFRANLSAFLKDAHKVTDEDGNPEVSGEESALKGLYFCGFYVSPTGMLREISIEARKIARAIAESP